MRLGASAIIINKDKRVLLLKRTSYTNAFPHFWTMPGGRGEPGERPEQIVVREVKEEAGLEFIPEGVYATHQTINSGEEVLSSRFSGTYSGKISIQEEEAEGYAWWSYAEAIKLDLAFDYREILESLHTDGLI